MFARPRTVAIAAVAAFLVSALAACGEDLDAAEREGNNKVRFMIFPGVANRLPVMAALDRGYFGDEGIEIEMVNQPDAIPGVQALKSTESQVGQFSVATLGQANQAGEDVRFFCGAIRVVQSSLMATIDSKLPSTADGATWEVVLASLKGKRVGVQTPIGSGFQRLLQGTLESAGATDVTYVNVGGSNAQADAALKTGSLDAAIGSPPGPQLWESSGDFKLLAYLPDGPPQYKDYYGSGYGAPAEWLEEHPDDAEAFCKAVEKGIAFIQDPANAEAATKLLSEDTKLPADIAATVLKETFGSYSTELPKDAFDATLEGYVEYGVLEKIPEITYDNLVEDKTGN